MKHRDRLALDALKDMIRAYVRLLESGCDRIKELGGECDPVDVMERSDPYLRECRKTIAALEAAPSLPVPLPVDEKVQLQGYSCNRCGSVEIVPNDSVDDQKTKTLTAVAGFSNQSICIGQHHLQTSAAPAAPAAKVELPVVAWRPIEIAPKDKKILLWWGGSVVFGGWLDNSKSKWPWEGWQTQSLTPRPAGRPTHWMHLPAAPDAKTAIAAARSPAR